MYQTCFRVTGAIRLQCPHKPPVQMQQKSMEKLRKCDVTMTCTQRKKDGVSVFTGRWGQKQSGRLATPTTSRRWKTFLKYCLPHSIELEREVIAKLTILAADHVHIALFHCRISPIQRTTHHNTAIHHHEPVLHMHLPCCIHGELDVRLLHRLHTGIFVLCLHVVREDTHIHAAPAATKASAKTLWLILQTATSRVLWALSICLHDARETCSVLVIWKEDYLLGHCASARANAATSATSPLQQAMAALSAFALAAIPSHKSKKRGPHQRTSHGPVS